MVKLVISIDKQEVHNWERKFKFSTVENDNVYLRTILKVQIKQNKYTETLQKTKKKN